MSVLDARSLSPVLGGPSGQHMTSDHNGVRRVESAWRRFALLYLTVLALGVGAAFAFSDQIYWSWVERYEGPALQSAFGFVVERRESPPGSVTKSRLVVVSVVPGGRFARAGVQSDDAIVCLYHGRGDFWGALQSALQGQEVTIRVLQLSELAKGCDGSRRIVLSP